MRKLFRGEAMVTSGDIHAAIESGNLELLQDLVRRDRSAASARDTKGVSALMSALYRGRQDMVAVLLGVEPDLDVFEASALGNVPRLEQIIRSDPSKSNVFSADGFTPLHLACFFRQEGSARLLLNSGADPSAIAKNNMRVQPLHSAAAARQRHIAEMLLHAGASVNAKQHGGWTALHAAAQHGDVETAELLLEYGADPSLANDDGRAPADLAAGNEGMERLFARGSARRQTAS